MLWDSQVPAIRKLEIKSSFASFYEKKKKDSDYKWSLYSLLIPKEIKIIEKKVSFE